MLKTLLESALIELLQDKKDIDVWIDYTYSNLDKSNLTDIEKEIKKNNIGRVEFEVMLCKVFNDDDFREELKELDLEII